MPKHREIPIAAEAWLGELMTSYRGKLAHQRRAAILIWECWRETGNPELAIPGYPVCPPDCGTGHPAGWTYQVFRRIAREIALTPVSVTGGTGLKQIPRASSTDH